jgi:hypothetical protein
MIISRLNADMKESEKYRVETDYKLIVNLYTGTINFVKKTNELVND